MIRQQRTLPGPSDENGCRYYSSSRRQCKAFADYLARDSSVAVRGGIDEMAICWLFSVRTTFPVVIFLALLGAQWLAQAPSPDSLKPKIFVLGLSKTGTTSIGDALDLLGYRRLGWRDIRSRHMAHTFIHGDYAPLVELTRYYDAFEDLPWPFLYKQMAELYPDAKFILSTRKNDETWMRSMQVHLSRGKWLPYTHFYGADTFEGNEATILQSYQNHSHSVREFFRNQPDRYLELNIDGGDANWHMLCRVAQCPGNRVPSISFPRSNTAASWDLGFLANKIQWLKGWLTTRSEEQISRYYYHSRRGLFKPVLSFGWSICDFLQRACLGVYFGVMPLLYRPLDLNSNAQT